MEPEIKREFEKLHKKLNDMMASERKATWVGPGWVTDITGWNNEKLRQARDQHIVEFKRSEGGGYVYRLESIPEIFILKNKAS